MKQKMAEPVPEGEEPKSVVVVVADVLTKACPSNTFLKNVGLESGSRNKFNKSNAAVAAHVIDLEDRLEREQQQNEAMCEELASIKKKAEEAEAAQALRDKDYELLRKRAEETDARFAHMMALLTGKASGS